MTRIKMLKEPGYVYDLIFIFFLKFNMKLCVDVLKDQEKQPEAIDHFNYLTEHFSDISEDLFVFFHAVENGRCFIATEYFNAYKDYFTTTYNFKFLQRELRDKDRLIRNLISFYFYDMSEEELDKCVNSNVELFAYIKNSKYTDSEKNKLYEFFINPEPYIQTLQYELMEKEFMLSKYYEKNYQKIIDVYNKTTFEILFEQVKGINDIEFIDKNNLELYTSYCLLNKFCINFFGAARGAVYILGYDYLDFVNFVKEKKFNFNLQDFGNVICEENRLKILKLLLDCNEVTCKDLEKLFSFSGSTAYHHMTMMMKVGIVKTRNEGKLIFYSLNRAYFDAVIDVLGQFASKNN